jgi:hypothetical protein
VGKIETAHAQEAMMRYEIRYSSSEMMYLEVAPNEVRCYLDHSPSRASRWSFDEVLAANEQDIFDAEVRTLFSPQQIAQVRAEVQRRVAAQAPDRG